jgi:hypothetical protein
MRILAMGALLGAVLCLGGPEAQARMGGGGMGGMGDMHRGSGFGDGGCGGAGSLPIDCFRPDDYPEYYAPTYHVSRSKHVSWCKAHYRTYSVKTDKFTGKSGKKYRCNSPYDGY